MNIELIKNVIKQLEPNVRLYENIIKEKNKEIVTLTLITDENNSASPVQTYMQNDIPRIPKAIETPAGRLLTGSVEPPHVGLISKAVNESPNTSYSDKKTNGTNEAVRVAVYPKSLTDQIQKSADAYFSNPHVNTMNINEQHIDNNTMTQVQELVKKGEPIPDSLLEKGLRNL